MSQHHTVECPSGLVVTIREFRVSDEDLLANPKNQRKGVAVTALLEALTISVDEVGPYTLKRKGEEQALDWNSVLQGDRMVVLLKNRIFTWGEVMSITQPCENCRSKIEMDIDLNDLKIKPLPDSSRPHVIAPDDAPLTCTLPNGAVVHFRLLRGKDDQRLNRLQKQAKDALSSAYLRFRITGIEGVKSTDLQRYLGDLGGRDAGYLRAAFEEADCGVDQAIEFECDDCGHIFEQDVKFRADFLFPNYRAKT